MKRVFFSIILLMGMAAGNTYCQPIMFSKMYDFYGSGASSMLFHDSVTLFNAWYITDSGDQGLRLCEIDPHGNLMNDHYFSKPGKSYEYLYAGSLLKIDANYYVGGTVGWADTFDIFNNYTFPFLAKYDLNKDTLWVKQYSEDTNFGYQIRAYTTTLDKGIILAGGITSRVGPYRAYYDYYILKLDSAGNILWTKTYGLQYLDEGIFDVCELPDSSLMFSGQKETYNDPQKGFIYTPWLVKTDKNGNLQWQRTYTTPAMQYEGSLIKRAWTNGYLMWGALDTVYDSNDFEYPGYLAKLDDSGKIIWRTVFHNAVPIAEGLWDIEVLANGKLIACGGKLDTTYRSNGNLYDFLMQLDSNGNVIWEHDGFFTDSLNYNYLFCVRALPDGGFIACGTGENPATSIQNAWVLRLDSNGCETMNCIAHVSVPQVPANEDGVKVWPNPAQNEVEVAINRGSDGMLTAYDMMGKCMVKQPLSGQSTMPVNTAAWLPGIYLLVVQLSDGSYYRQKLVIEK